MQDTREIWLEYRAPGRTNPGSIPAGDTILQVLASEAGIVISMLE